MEVDPYIPDGEVPTVEHPLPVIAPLLGIAIVPVTPPVGAGLTPSDVISVESSGTPIGEIEGVDEMPSGEVAPIVGVGVAIPSTWSSTCAMATLHAKSAGRTAANKANLIDIPCF